MCAARCYRSLKRDEEITLWRSLCALGAPLYGNLCISFSPFLLLFSFSFSPSLASRFLSLFLFVSRFFLVHPISRILFCSPPSFLLCSLISLRALLSLRFILHLARSLDEAYGVSPIPSFAAPRSFPSTPRLTAFPFFLSFSLSSFLSFFLILLCSTVRAPLPLPLFPLLVYFSLPVGNCTLSLLPARRFSLVLLPHIRMLSYSFPYFFFISSFFFYFPLASFYFTF